jgi:hypothetical protein
MASQPPTSNCKQRTLEPFYDIDARTGAWVEVFYADRSLETFGRGGAGWFWWSGRCGCPRNGSPIGPFATNYAAYRHALGTALGAEFDALSNFKVKSSG